MDEQSRRLSSKDLSDRSGACSDSDGYETDLTEPDATSGERSLLAEDRDHSPGYYERQLNDLDTADLDTEDYRPGTTSQLDRIEQQWHQ